MVDLGSMTAVQALQKGLEVCWQFHYCSTAARPCSDRLLLW